MDPIANMLTSLRSAQAVKKTAVFHVSKIKTRILEILREQGYIARYVISKDTAPKATVELTEKPLDNVVRISKPGRRLYAKAREIKVRPGLLTVISTPKGITTGQDAKKKNLGGEILFEVRS